MDYRTLDTLRQKHPAWRLLTADHAPLIVSFLNDTFVQPNIRTLAQPDLASRLDDYLYTLRLELGENVFPREALLYLENWASDEHAWLRKYYPTNSDVPHFDITPATEKAIDWLAGLGQRQFVGTESRLMMVFELLHQLVEGTEKDPWVRIGELERRRNEIDSEIDRIRKGHPCSTGCYTNQGKVHSARDHRARAALGLSRGGAELPRSGPCRTRADCHL